MNVARLLLANAPFLVIAANVIAGESLPPVPPLPARCDCARVFAPPMLVPLPDPVSRLKLLSSKGADPRCGADENGDEITPCSTDNPEPDCPQRCPDGTRVCAGTCPGTDSWCPECETPDGSYICKPCDADGDEKKESCYLCDALGENGDPGHDGVNDTCFTCDNDNDSKPDGCKACDRYGADGNPGTDGVLDSCYDFDSDGDNVKDSCCPDFRLELAFDDDFSGRSRVKAGVGETGTVLVIAAAGVNPSDLDPITFGSSDSGCVAVDSQGSFRAGKCGCSATITATVADGCTSTISLTVVEPTGAYMRRAASIPLWHENGYASLGYKASIWLTPKDVSFNWVEIREGASPVMYSGDYFNHPSVIEGHPTGFWKSVGWGDIETGSRVDGQDCIQAGKYGPGPNPSHVDDGPPKEWGRDSQGNRVRISIPFTDSSYTWNIPVYYRVGHDATASVFGKVFATYQQIVSVDSQGTMQISKAGQYVWVLLNAATSGSLCGQGSSAVPPSEPSQTYNYCAQ